MKILLAEDNLFYRRMLEAMLTDWGYEIVAASDGNAAWQVLQQPQAPPLAILSWMMPGMDGLEVCRQVRALNKSQRTYLILVTAKRGQDNITAAMQSGADDYLVKPFAPEELRLRLQVGLRIVNSPVDQATTLPTVRSQETHNAPVLVHADVPTQLIGVAVPGYEILGELGRGGMGIVFKARHICMDRVVALKVINPDHLANPDAVRRFYQEVQAAARLFHPNIVVAHDAGQVENTHYLSMEYVDGISLSHLVKRSGPLPVEQACDFIRQASLGLQHAHERGLVHRDINPSNLIRANPPWRPPWRWGRVKILDLGLARLQQPASASPVSADLTREGRWMGTVDYIAPEQWMDARAVDTRADLYSLGCTFFYLLTGQVPFPADGVVEKMLKHHSEDPPPVEQFQPDVPPEIAAVVRRLMAKQPAQRYQAPVELFEALQSLSQTASRPTS